MNPSQHVAASSAPPPPADSSQPTAPVPQMQQATAVKPTVKQLLQAVMGLVKTQQQLQQRPPPAPSEAGPHACERTINEFKKVAPSPFSSTTNPDDAEL